MDGSRVKLGQEISMENAEKLVLWHLSGLEEFIPANVNQNQADALYSFMFNVGSGNFQKSDLRKLILVDANNPAIRNQFMRWVTSRGKVLEGLVKRRIREADLYFKPI